jgi:heptosyltransferase-3
MTKTLVWHAGALGDLVLSFPALYTLKTGGRAAHLHLISRTEIADVIIENRLADEVSAIDNGIFAEFFVDCTLSTGAAEFLGTFADAFIFMKNVDEVFANNLRRHIPKCLFIPTRPEEGRVMHLSAAQLELLKRSGIASGKMPCLEAGPFPSGVHGGRTIVTIHPGSGGKKKCWPADNFLELVKLLGADKRFYFYFILGPAEGSGLHEISERFFCENKIDASVVAGRPVSDIAPLLKSSSLHVGNDSGITHLASSLGTPTIAVFGPTDQRVWGPFGSHTQIITSGYPCSPCSEEDRRRCPDVPCLGSLKVDAVLPAARDILGKTFRK